ncbi:MAG: glycosyltransferase [Acidimicrobiia bacterium]
MAQVLGVSRTSERRSGARVALAHDYLAARGGAERFLIAVMDLYPEATIYTSLFEPDLTFPNFASRRVISSPLNLARPLRRHYRSALPLLPWAFGHLEVDADVVVCTTSGWSHGIVTDVPKIAYCHTPARWLYQRDDYTRGMKSFWLAATVSKPLLQGWDRRAAASCDRYLASSRAIAERVRRTYGIEAEVLPPPTSLDVTASREPVEGIGEGFFLSVGRLLGYKHVDALLAAFDELGPGFRLVVAGDGPLRTELHSRAGANVTFLGEVNDAQLRWLYANCTALLSAADEDFGLTPIEAGLFGKPCGVIRKNGFIDTTIPGETGLFFEELRPRHIADAVRQIERASWDAEAIALSADRFSAAGFRRRLDTIIEETVGRPPTQLTFPGELSGPSPQATTTGAAING